MKLITISNFEVFRRGDLSMSEFLIEFEKRYTKLKTHNLELPEELQCCKLLEIADLQQYQKQMLLPAVTRQKNSEVKKVLRMFVGVGEIGEESIGSVKPEVFFANNNNYRNSDRCKNDFRSKKDGTRQKAEWRRQIPEINKESLTDVLSVVLFITM